MSRKKQRSPQECERDEKAILGAGYKIHKFSEYHWHVRQAGSWRVVNVWPTAGKYMEVGASGSNVYKNVLKTIDKIFKEEVIDTKEAEQAVSELRTGGLDYFKNKTNK